jgi:acyl dehydratase
MSGLLHYEDFSEGQVIDLGGYTPSRVEVIAFAREFDPQPFHLDEVAARASIFGGLCASGWHTCAIVMRMIADGFLSHSAGMGSNGVDEVKWLKPVFADEPLTAALTILGMRVSAKRPEMGVFTYRVELASATGERKCEMTGVFFMKVRAP